MFFIAKKSEPRRNGLKLTVRNTHICAALEFYWDLNFTGDQNKCYDTKSLGKRFAGKNIQPYFYLGWFFIICKENKIQRII